MEIVRLSELVISIPTPARGVTALLSGTLPTFTNFNSHPREGGDVEYLVDSDGNF